MSSTSYYKVVGNNIIRARISRKITQEGLAILSDIDRTYVGKIEKGAANPSLMILKKISRVLKFSVSKLTENI